MKPVSLAITLALLLAVAPLSAQTASVKAYWDMAEAPAVAQTFSFSLKVDATPAIILSTVVCVAAIAPSPGSSCSAPVAPLTTGTTHTLVITAANAFGAASSNPLSGPSPSQPSNFKLVLTITVP